jgi:hypothetical protein
MEDTLEWSFPTHQPALHERKTLSPGNRKTNAGTGLSMPRIKTKSKKIINLFTWIVTVKLSFYPS